MEKQSNQSSAGISFPGLLGIVFIVLKLTGFINWSWWWVTAPLWGGIALVAVVLLLVCAFYAVENLIKRIFKRG